MKLGYSTWGMPSLPIDTALQHLSSLGFDGVEIAVLPGWTTELDRLDMAERTRIHQLADRFGLEISAVSSHRSLLDQTSEAHAENLRRLHGAIDLCVAWAGNSGPPVLATILGGRVVDWELMRETMLDRLGALVDYAARKGVVVALEPHVGVALDLPEKALWLLAQIDSRHLKLNFDISHFEVLGIPTAESVAALAPHAAHTHVKDQRGRAPAHEFLIPGEGTFAFGQYLEEMKKAGYDGYITAEISMMVQRRPDYDPLTAAKQTYQVLNRAFGQAGLRAAEII